MRIDETETLEDFDLDDLYEEEEEEEDGEEEETEEEDETDLEAEFTQKSFLLGRVISKGQLEQAEKDLEALEQWLTTHLKDLTPDLAEKITPKLEALDKKIAELREKTKGQSKPSTTPAKPSEPKPASGKPPTKKKTKKKTVAAGPKENQEGQKPAGQEQPQKKIKLL